MTLPNFHADDGQGDCPLSEAIQRRGTEPLNAEQQQAYDFLAGGAGATQRQSLNHEETVTAEIDPYDGIYLRRTGDRSAEYSLSHVEAVSLMEFTQAAFPGYQTTQQIQDIQSLQEIKKRLDQGDIAGALELISDWEDELIANDDGTGSTVVHPDQLPTFVTYKAPTEDQADE